MKKQGLMVLFLPNVVKRLMTFFWETEHTSYPLVKILILGRNGIKEFPPNKLADRQGLEKDMD